MSYFQIRAAYLQNLKDYDRHFVITPVEVAGYESKNFAERWAELTYFERRLTAERLSRPGLQCPCLPPCAKW